MTVIAVFCRLVAGEDGDVCHPGGLDSLQDGLHKIVTDAGIGPYIDPPL